MRPRFGTAAVLAVALLAPMIAAGGVGTPTSAGLVLTQQTSDPSPQRVGLKELLNSLVNGTSPLITAVEATPFTPYGGEVIDDTGQATINGVFHVRVNLGPGSVLSGLDFDGDSDIGGPIERVSFDDPSTINPLNGVHDPVFDLFAPPFGPGSPFPPPLNDLPDDFFDVPVTIVESIPGDFLTGGTVDIWGASFDGPLPPAPSCGGQLLEFGMAFHREGQPAWDPPVSDSDFFTGASDAIINRCDGTFSVVGLNNTGSFFGPQDTDTTTVFFDTGFLSITDSREFIDTTGHRIVSFRTPAVGGGQPDNTIATTYPAMPALAAPMTPFLVGTPFPTDAGGPYPINLDLIPIPGAPPECGGEWSALFEIFVQEGADPETFDAQIYQFESGQFTVGDLILSDEGFQLQTEGAVRDTPRASTSSDRRARIDSHPANWTATTRSASATTTR